MARYYRNMMTDSETAIERITDIVI